MRKMAKGQTRSNKDVRKPKAEAPEKTNVSGAARKQLGIRSS